MATLRFVVSGRVQGVFFRASTRAEATRLGLAGSARNLDDGRVEVIAVGSDAALAALERWLWEGPPSARVESVACESIADRPAEGFRIL
jgi:acylphosphatase